jgi:hypothetical protein
MNPHYWRAVDTSVFGTGSQDVLCERTVTDTPLQITQERAVILQ